MSLLVSWSSLSRGVRTFSDAGTSASPKIAASAGGETGEEMVGLAPPPAPELPFRLDQPDGFRGTLGRRSNRISSASSFSAVSGDVDVAPASSLGRGLFLNRLMRDLDRLGRLERSKSDELVSEGTLEIDVTAKRR
jgi:hypothetical protein